MLSEDPIHTHIFEVQKVDNPFRFSKKEQYLNALSDFKVAKWNDVDNDALSKSKQLNDEVIRQFLLIMQLEILCNKGDDLKDAFYHASQGFGSVDFSDVKSQICKSVGGNAARRYWDVISKDQDAFEHAYDYSANYNRYPEKAKINVVVITNRSEYLGHVYTWISPTKPDTCFMIGIRSNVIMPHLRKIGYGAERVSGLIIEGVKKFALSQGVNTIMATDPIGKMPKILRANGFQRQSLPNRLTGDAGGLTQMSGTCSCFRFDIPRSEPDLSNINDFNNSLTSDEHRPNDESFFRVVGMLDNSSIVLAPTDATVRYAATEIFQTTVDELLRRPTIQALFRQYTTFRRSGNNITTTSLLTGLPVTYSFDTKSRRVDGGNVYIQGQRNVSGAIVYNIDGFVLTDDEFTILKDNAAINQEPQTWQDLVGKTYTGRVVLDGDYVEVRLSDADQDMLFRVAGRYVSEKELGWNISKPRAWTYYGGGPHVTINSSYRHLAQQNTVVSVTITGIEHFTDGSRWVTLKARLKPSLTCPYGCHLSIGQQRRPF